MITRLARHAVAGWMLALSLGSALTAQETPVVVELFTSQGCSSCPPADALLHRLAARDDVIALALHVDYWDYIGWKDAFARPEHTQRQKRYAHTAGRRTIYTPEMVINGVDSVVGARTMEIVEAIQAHQAQSPRVHLRVVRRGDQLDITAKPLAVSEAMIVTVLRYRPKEHVKIRRGENAGKTLTYANIVSDWQQVAEWSGRAEMHAMAAAPGDLPAVVLVQAKGPGRILAAAEVK